MVPDESRVGVFLSPLLAAEPWLDHGFGGRRAANWPPDPFACATRQVHGADVLMVMEPGNNCGEGDALITSRAGLFIGIRTADCVPILLADRRRRMVAAVHAGWRGTAARILERAVETLSSDPRDLVAACGPSIGPCCYEVGPEVAKQFGLTGHARIDLAQENARQLARLGVPPEAIDARAVPCTRCEAEHFHSFRRDGEKAGRMVAAIAVR